MALKQDDLLELGRIEATRHEVEQTPTPAPKAITPYREPTPTVFESLEAGFTANGITTGLIKLAMEDSTPERDRSWELAQSMEDEEVSTFINDTIVNRTQPGNDEVLAHIAGAGSDAEVRMIMRQAEESREKLETAMANGTMVGLLGAGGGFLLDAGIITLASLATGGTAGPWGAGAIWTARTAGVQRILAGSRLATLGAIEGAVERAIHAETDPTIGVQDMLAEAGFSSLAGAGLGVLAPRWAGGVQLRRIQNGADVLDAQTLNEGIDAGTTRASQAQPVGAAVAPPPAAARPIRAQRSLMSRVFGASGQGTRMTFLSNPRRVMVDLMERAARFGDETGNHSLSEVSEKLSKLIRTSEVREDELAGQASRGISYQDIQRDLRVGREVRRTQSDQNYAEAVKDVFDKGWFSRKIAGPGARALSRVPSAEEFEEMARLAHLKKADPEKYADRSILDANSRFRETVDDETLDRLLPHLEKEGAMEQAYYDEYVPRLVEAGLVDEDDVIDFYQPQIWDVEAIEGNAAAFKNVLRHAILRQGPSDEFLHAEGMLRTPEDVARGVKLQEELDEFAGKDAPKTPQGKASREKAVAKRQEELKVIEGKFDSIEDFKAKDPDLYAEYLDIWDGVIKEMTIDAADEAEAVIREELKILDAKTVGEAIETAETKVAPLRKRAAKMEAQLQALGKSKKTAPSRANLSTRLSKLERRIADETDKLDAMYAAQGDTLRMREAAEKFGSRGRRRGLGKVAQRLAKAEQKSIRAQMRNTIGEQVDSITSNILGEQALAGMPPAFMEQAGRFKRRYLHLGTAEFDPEVRKFLRTDRRELRQRYQESAGNHLALREALGTPSTVVGNDAPPFIQAHLTDMMKAFDAAEAAPGLTGAQKATLVKDRRAARLLFTKLTDEITHQHNINLNKGAIRGWTALEATANNTVAAAMLGSSMLAQVGDLSTMLLASTRHRRMLEAVWRNPAIKRELKELWEKEPELMVYIQGLTSTSNSRINVKVDADNFAVGTTGSKLRTMERWSSNAAQLEMTVNGMNWLTKWQQRIFGNAFVVGLERDLNDWANVPDHIKTIYAKRGISTDEAARMKVLLDKHHHVIGGRWKAPDTAAWIAAGEESLLRKYKKALDTAQEEAVITPDVGDRPFIRHMPFGKMLTGLLGYAYAASDRVLMPAVGRVVIKPTDATPYLATMMALQLGIFSDFTRAAIRGEHEEWLDQLEDEEGFRDLMAKGLLRSPLAVAHSSIVSEVAMNSFGRQANDAIEHMTGIRPLPQAATRFREQQGVVPILGPTFSLGQRALRVGQKAADGDFEKAFNQASRMTPVINTFYVQAFLNLMKDQ